MIWRILSSISMPIRSSRTSVAQSWIMRLSILKRSSCLVKGTTMLRHATFQPVYGWHSTLGSSSGRLRATRGTMRCIWVR